MAADLMQPLTGPAFVRPCAESAPAPLPMAGPVLSLTLWGQGPSCSSDCGDHARPEAPLAAQRRSSIRAASITSLQASRTSIA